MKFCTAETSLLHRKSNLPLSRMVLEISSISYFFSFRAVWMRKARRLATKMWAFLILVVGSRLVTPKGKKKMKKFKKQKKMSSHITKKKRKKSSLSPSSLSLSLGEKKDAEESYRRRRPKTISLILSLSPLVSIFRDDDASVFSRRRRFWWW